MEKFLNYFIPDHYDLELHLSHKEQLISGTVAITGEVHSETIRLHAVDMAIKGVRLGDQSCDYQYDQSVLTVLAPANNDETSTITIDFEGKINTNMQGCYSSHYEWQGEQRQIIATQFESHYAREAFPCIDEPAAKAEFALTLVIPDRTDEDVILANMPLASRDGDCFTFATTPRMPTYLLAWVVGPLKHISTTNANGVEVSSYCALNQPESALEFANQTAARALEYYDQKFGEKYPLPKLDQVALPDFEAGAMENWGLVTYRETMMLAEPKAAIDTKKIVATTVTHELSHQWFGNLVTMAWWDDLWLNESFATIIEYYAADALYPELNVWEDFFTGDCLAALRRDCLPGVQSVQQEVRHPAEIATLFDSAIVYAKGAHLILMLIRYMGEEAFDKGIRDYFDRYKYQNTVGDNLWECLQTYADFDVRKFMHAWISQPGYPALQSAHNGDQSWWVQQRFLIDGTTDDTEWPLPEIKDDLSGHYIIEWGADEFQRKLDAFATLGIEQKLRLLIDRMLLAKAGIVSSADLLDLLPQFAHESSSAVWEILASIIGDLKLFCPPETPSAENYQQFLSSTFANELHSIQLDSLTDPNEITRRSILLGIAYYVEDEAILRQLAALYDDDLAKLDPELRSHILSAKLYFDEAEVIDDWLAKYQQLTDPELKHALLGEIAMYARRDTTLDRLFDLLHQPEIVRPQDHIYLYIYLLRNYRTRARVITWLTENWDHVVQLTGDKSVEDYPRYAANVIRTPAEAKVFFDFFDQKQDLPILERTLKIARTEIDSRLALIRREQPQIDQVLCQLTDRK